MSRTRHKLQSEDWYGQWAGYFHRENRDMRQRGLEKRRKSDERLYTGCTCGYGHDTDCIVHGSE